MDLDGDGFIDKDEWGGLLADLWLAPVPESILRVLQFAGGRPEPR